MHDIFSPPLPSASAAATTSFEKSMQKTFIASTKEHSHNRVVTEHGYHQTIPPKEGPKNDEKMSNGSTWAPPPPIPSLRASSPY